MNDATPSPATHRARVELDESLKALSRSSALAAQLGGALESLKICLSRGDIELAEIRAQAVEILQRRLADQFERSAYVRGLELSKPSSTAAAPRLAADPLDEEPAGDSGIDRGGRPDGLRDRWDGDPPVTAHQLLALLALVVVLFTILCMVFAAYRRDERRILLEGAAEQRELEALERFDAGELSPGELRAALGLPQYDAMPIMRLRTRYRRTTRDA